MRFYIWIVFLVAIVAAWSCQPAEEIIDVQRPKVVPFTGKVDPRFVGTWKTDNGMSTYQLKEDGAYVLDSTIRVQGQAPIQSHLEGEWRLDGDRLLFKDGNGNVVPYAFTIKDDTLELGLTGKLKTKTVLKRQ